MGTLKGVNSAVGSDAEDRLRTVRENGGYGTRNEGIRRCGKCILPIDLLAAGRRFFPLALRSPDSPDRDSETLSHHSSGVGINSEKRHNQRQDDDRQGAVQRTGNQAENQDGAENQDRSQHNKRQHQIPFPFNRDLISSNIFQNYFHII